MTGHCEYPDPSTVTYSYANPDPHWNTDRRPEHRMSVLPWPFATFATVTVLDICQEISELPEGGRLQALQRARSWAHRGAQRCTLGPARDEFRELYTGLDGAITGLLFIGSL